MKENGRKWRTRQFLLSFPVLFKKSGNYWDSWDDPRPTVMEEISASAHSFLPLRWRKLIMNADEGGHDSWLEVQVLRRSGNGKWDQASCVIFQAPIGKMRRLEFTWSPARPPRRISVSVYPANLRVNTSFEDYHLLPETWPLQAAFALSLEDRRDADGYQELHYDSQPEHQRWECYLQIDKTSGDEREYHMHIECWFHPPNQQPRYYEYVCTNMFMASDHKTESNAQYRPSRLRLHPIMGFSVDQTHV